MRITFCAECGRKFKNRRDWQLVSMCRDDRQCWRRKRFNLLKWPDVTRLHSDLQSERLDKFRDYEMIVLTYVGLL